MAKYLVNDARREYRDAFVADNEEELSEILGNYSGYYVVENLGDISADEADNICARYNSYAGEPDVELHCCSKGCTMCAWEYARMTGCAYSGT